MSAALRSTHLALLSCLALLAAPRDARAGAPQTEGPGPSASSPSSPSSPPPAQPPDYRYTQPQPHPETYTETPDSHLADDFRNSDPEEADLSAVAQSSGLIELSAVQPRGDILELAEVLDALLSSDPRLEIAERKREKADGKLMAARGGFDPKLAARGMIQPLSYYQQGYVDVKLSQATPLWGLGVWTGWRLGAGDFAAYDGKLLTADGGELRLGVTLPLWQGGPIDQTRADIAKAKAERERTTAARDAKQLELEAKAAEVYWKWVAAGLKLEIERALLEIAMARDIGLRRQIELGGKEKIVGTDNRRLVLDREARVVSAERTFQAAILELSLFLRDANGDPELAGADRLPLAFPPPVSPPPIDLESEIDGALERRPDLAAGMAEREQAEVEVRLARNLRSPRIDLSSWIAQDLGPGPAELTPFELAAVVELEVPIPLRKGRGTLAAARAELAAVDAQLRFLRDTIAVGVLDAHSALAAAYQRARLAKEQVSLAQTLASAELRRFELGAGDLLLVNLRELAAAKAASEYVEALAAYWAAMAKLEVARGESVDGAP